MLRAGNDTPTALRQIASFAEILAVPAPVMRVHA
jgi:hypothetical protein